MPRQHKTVPVPISDFIVAMSCSRNEVQFNLQIFKLF